MQSSSLAIVRTARPALLDRRLSHSLIALQRAVTGDAFIKATFRVLQAGARCDFVSVCLRIVRKEHANLAYRMIDSRGREFGPELMEGVFFREHPAMPKLLANPGIKFINTRETLAPNDVLRNSRFYREVMRVIGFRHAIGVFFWNDAVDTPEAIFSLCRAEGEPDFEKHEIAVLAKLHPHIDAAFRRVRLIENERAIGDELRTLVHRSDRPICVLDWKLRVTEANHAAREISARWIYGSASARLKTPPFRLPPALRDACAEMKAEWQASLQKHPRSGASERRVILHPREPSLGATVTLQIHHSGPIGKPAFLVEFGLAAKPEHKVNENCRRTALPAFGARERELIRLICAGRSNQEIANETRRALGTVKNSLHGIYRKAGVKSRTALMAIIATVNLA